MRKSILLFTVVGLFFLLLISSVFAYDACNDSAQFVPCARGGYNFDTYIYGTGWGNVTIYYRADCAHVGHEVNNDPNIYDVVVNNGTCQLQCGVYGWGGCQGGASLAGPIVAWVGPGAPHQLTVTLNPATGGSVTSSPAGIDCGTDCQENLSGSVTLDASAAQNWAFGFWDDGSTSYTEKPKTFTVDSNKTITAKFFKTFTNRVGNFQASTGSTIDTGECVPYVRYETGVPIYGDAYTWYGQAASANYATSATVPRVGSIIVFAVQGGMTSGHVGIVTSISGTSLGIRSQNWHNDGKVSDDTVDVNGYTITGYIYYTP